MNIAVIGGTGVDEIAEFGDVTTVTTPFGDAEVVDAELHGVRFLFVPRHGTDHSVPPGRINYRAQIAALKMKGVHRVIGVCAVGSLTRDLPAGSFAVLGDFIDLTKKRADTFFDLPNGPVVHTDFTHPYCTEVSEALRSACQDTEIVFGANAVYIGVEGPRYETPAEVKLYASWGGHVIGMTNVPEVVLAREAGLCYGALGIVSNLASGISPTPLSHDEVRKAMATASNTLAEVLRRSIERLPETRICTCGSNTGLII
ncbi:MAG: MTAP family purine nucleoside phosphorylase [Armatimonadota bacterium]